MTNLDAATSASRASAHRPHPIALPSDPAVAAALVLRYVQQGSSDFDRASAIEAANSRLSVLRDPNTGIDSILDELTGHMMLLDALFQRFAAEAMAARLPDHKAKFVKLALGAQASYARTAIAVEGLRAQKHGNARLFLNEGEDRSG